MGTGDLTTPGRAGFGGRWSLPLRESLALLGLLFGFIAGGLGWFVGVALLLNSPRWTGWQKLRGILILPFGLAPALLVDFSQTDSCSVSASGTEFFGSGPLHLHYVTHCTGTSWVATVLVLVLFLAPIVNVISLGRAAVRATPEPHHG